ncbi:MAG: SDR family NAD(P)-dependent oxidoreductase [Lentisphaeria bacterium]|nr:NAD-dependent 4,6-dehydratase LegB [Lentisphaeria bacterium]NQZ69229.1 SDR family NAD(P)-dependent oxidoreductase [Lentisphaeria bacterium]
MSLKGKKVLVTGADGFIGSHLTESLVDLGADVRAMVVYNSLGSWGWLDHSSYKNDIDVFAGDIRDHDSVMKAVDQCQIVYHLAALIAIPYSYQAPSSYISTNINGTLNVCQAVRAHDVERLVHTSTSEVYGTAQTVPINESHPLQGQSPYSASKIGADKIAESFHCSFELPLVTVRPFNTYGPRQSARAVIPTIITQALNNPVIKLGALSPTRDLNYVKDTAAGFIAASLSEKAIGEVVNIGSGKEISIGDLAELILDIMGIDKSIECDAERLRPKNSEVERLLADNSKAAKLLDWKPEHTLRQGLESCVEWFSKEENLALYKTDRYNV